MSDISPLSKYKFICRTLLAVIITLVLFAGAYAQERTIAVIPFEVHGSQDYQYMKQAAADMFSSRLAKVPGYRPVSESRIKSLDIDSYDPDFDNALSMGKELDAETVLYGSLTVLGESWSIDAAIADVEKKRLINSYSLSGADTQKIIPAIETMSADMAKDLKKSTAAEKSEGPDKDTQSMPHAGFKAAEPERTEFTDSWSSREIEKDFVGISAGDVTGNGGAEIVLVDEDAVYIYTLSDKNFKHTEKIDTPFNTKCLAVDTGDINGNGKSEIFVTACNNKKNSLKSFILEYREGGFTTILEKSQWFYRVANCSGSDPMLLGQRYKTESDPFGSEIVRLFFKNGKYVQGEPLVDSGSGINVLGFAPGQITGQGQTGAAAFDEHNKLRMLGPEGKTIWTSGSKYGRTSLFLQGPKEGRGEAPERFYLPGRILVTKSGADTKDSSVVFVFRNNDTIPISLKRVRAYSGGEILTLSWTGESLEEEWKTREYKGYLKDICLADLTGDGSLELAAILTEKEDWVKFGGSPGSRIMVFPVQQGRQ